MATNALWFYLPHEQNGSAGASGIVYGMIGIMVMQWLMNMMHAAEKHKKKMLTGKRLIGLVAVNSVVATPFLYYIFVDTGQFLSVGVGNNAVAHGLAFLIGLGIVLVQEYLPFMARIVRSSFVHPI